ETIRRAVEELARTVEPVQPGALGLFRSFAVEPYEPFPVDILPQPLRQFVIEGAASIGCDPDYIALPMLSALAAAIGNSRRVRLKRGWFEPSVLWTAVVGESCTTKSPTIELAL